MNKTIKKLQSIKDNLTTECITDTDNVIASVFRVIDGNQFARQYFHELLNEYHFYQEHEVMELIRERFDVDNFGLDDLQSVVEHTTDCEWHYYDESYNAFIDQLDYTADSYGHRVRDLKDAIHQLSVKVQSEKQEEFNMNTESKLSKQCKELWQMANEIDNVIDRVIRDDHSNNKANLPLAELALMQQISDELGYESSWEKLGFDKTDSVERLIEGEGDYNDFAEQLWEDIKDAETCDVLQSIGNINAEGEFVIDAASEVVK